MADQETQERDGDGSTDTTSSSTTTTESGTDSAQSDETGDDAQTEQTQQSQNESSKSGSDSDKSDSSKSDSGKSDSDESDSGESDSGKSGSGGSSDDAPARRSENHAKPQELSDEDREAQEANRNSFLGRRKKGGKESRQRRQIDVSDLVWRVGSILATVVRVVTLLFAVVLVAHIALVVVGVINPTNGVASFLRGFADTVVLGFRDLFLPADPTIMLVVNYGVAAVFWVVLGGFLSAGIRFVAARLS